MMKIVEMRHAAAYQAPVCDVLALEGQPICETSFNGGDIKPGEGNDWGMI